MALDTARLHHLAWQHASKVPAPLLRGAAALGADVATLLRPAGVRRLATNLARVRPDAGPRELRRLVRRAMRSYMRYFGEVFVLASATPEQVAARVRVEGRDECTRALATGTSPVVALTHQGNWDLAGVWASTHLAPVTTVAERLEPPALYEDFMVFRESLGMTILTAGDDGVFRALLRVAAAPGRLVCLLADRDLSRTGVQVDLLGHPARVAPGPAAVAVATGAPLLPAGIFYERLTGARRRAAGTPWGIVIRFHPAVEVPTDGTPAERLRTTTQGWVDALAHDIHEHPEDWHMLQKVFVADLDPERLARAEARP
ncbi:phosphatidylinositol mannoside acyltransferase [Sanguibacter suaedae]|uniref:Phosphatidylinositol mannoside acyltransferase n=1 Tax=Sanguibacter suaedae TaxID=2795737 RepID=A0A934I6U3_9MICO|nr:phosphatidylinositol mannoside acyltransferase [Sanguibacter suaedae]MBI9115306.1 phosphatidylinositol mannoside acyltransferase [Sanguibacter suaedae]